jgi:hypothetical protein
MTPVVRSRGKSVGDSNRRVSEAKFVLRRPVSVGKDKPMSNGETKDISRWRAEGAELMTVVVWLQYLGTRLCRCKHRV